MRVRFWGTRGSLPVAATATTIRAKLVNAVLAASGRSFATAAAAAAFVDDELDFAARGGYGGATSCVEIEAGDGNFIVCDMGSGLREFGLDAMRRAAGGHPRRYHFFLSHLHWDHIMGFPFFVPAFDAEATIVIHSGHADAETALRRQMEEISFPVAFDWLRARIEFVTLATDVPHRIGGVDVTMMEQYHSHLSYGYRFDAGGRTVIYSTDSEHRSDQMDTEARFEAFFKDADLVVCDTMYSLGDMVSLKQDWGHSSSLIAIDLCRLAAAKCLALFHHEPTYTDAQIQTMHAEARQYEALTRGDAAEVRVICAYDGLEVDV
ncbi:MAG: MBL fold metallo-hydrolase [Polymorphobacter sp.]